jgi:hypothetical protein
MPTLNLNYCFFFNKTEAEFSGITFSRTRNLPIHHPFRAGTAYKGINALYSRWEQIGLKKKPFIT